MTNRTSVLIDGIELPATPFPMDDVTPCAITPITITWGRKTPTETDNASTLDLTLHAGREGWANSSELVGHPIEVRYRDSLEGETEWARNETIIFTGRITSATVEHGSKVTYHIKASDLAYTLSRDPRKPSVMAPPYLGTSMTGLRYLNTVYGLDLDTHDGPLFFTEAYSNSDNTVLPHRVAAVEKADNVLDLTRNHHINAETPSSNNPAKVWADLWDCTALGESTVGYTDRRVIGRYSGWIDMEGQDTRSSLVDADTLAIQDDDLTEPTPYREIQWTSQRKDGDDFKDFVTTFPLNTGTKETFYDILAITSDEPNAPGDTIHAYGFEGKIDHSHLIAEAEEIGTRPRLPTMTAEWDPQDSSRMPAISRTGFLHLLIIGSKFENTDPRTHGWWAQTNGTLTYTRDTKKGMIWRHTFDVWPIPGPTESPTVADFKTWTPSAGTYRGSSLSKNKIGMLRYVNIFKETA